VPHIDPRLQRAMQLIGPLFVLPLQLSESVLVCLNRFLNAATVQFHWALPSFAGEGRSGTAPNSRLHRHHLDAGHVFHVNAPIYARTVRHYH